MKKSQVPILQAIERLQAALKYSESDMVFNQCRSVAEAVTILQKSLVIEHRPMPGGVCVDCKREVAGPAIGFDAYGNQYCSSCYRQMHGGY